MNCKNVEFSEMGLESLKNKDTLIASLWYDNNYGSIFSSYALYKCLETLGRKPVFLNRPVGFQSKQYNDPESRSCRFIYKNCSVAGKDLTTDEMDKCDMFLAGPGRIWELNRSGQDCLSYFYGGMIRASMKKVSWASSFGNSEGKLSRKILLDVKRYLNLYGGISVRDKYSAGFCTDNFSINPDIILDPVFLCNIDIFTSCMSGVDFESGDPYIFTYMENTSLRRRDFIEDGMFAKDMYSRNIEYPLGKNVFYATGSDDKTSSAEEWLAAIYNSDFVVTDDYYGICFAIIFEKPFIAIAPDDFNKLRELDDLLDEFELQERMVPCDNQTDLKDYMYLFKKKINYIQVKKIKDSLINDSLKWVRTYIAGD